LRKAGENALFKRSLAPPISSQRLPSRHDEEAIAEAAGESEVHEEFETRDRSRMSRPSLSERTIETLSQVSPSPAVGTRDASFYGSEGPSISPSRVRASPRPSFDSPGRPSSRSRNVSGPSSVYKRNPSTNPSLRSVSARPSSSSGPEGELFGKAEVIHISGGLEANNAPSELPPPIEESLRGRSTSPFRSSIRPPNFGATSRTPSSRGLKPKPSISGLSGKSVQTHSAIPPAREASAGSVSKGLSSQKTTTGSKRILKKPSPISQPDIDQSDEKNSAPQKSSNALREQIAKAKAARKAELSRHTSAAHPAVTDDESAIIPSGSFDFGLSDDPFNQGMRPDENKGLLKKRVDSARADGRLNIAAMGLTEIPAEVLNMYDLAAYDGGGSWAESVDLTRFIAADNNFEYISDEVFPDIDPRDFSEDEDYKGNQFGGLEALDLHGNMLGAVPLGLRRLELLTTLNLSYNKLSNDCFEVISQIPTLRDLKLGNNCLQGCLPASIAQLKNLEILDLQRNLLASLPEAIVELESLRVLNLTENQLRTLNFDVLQHLPLTDISAAKNKLSGVLISTDVQELKNLQVLNVINNTLTAISSSTIGLPVLHQLSFSANRITELPDMTSWTSLLTLAADDNSISEVPEGFVSLRRVKNVDFSGNNIKNLDIRIGAMENLDIFRISGNPLKERKLAGLSTGELKRTLKARMEPTEAEEGDTVDQGLVAENLNVVPISPTRTTTWPVKSGGVLDRSGTQMRALNPVLIAQVAAENSIRVLELHHNLFKEIPTSVAFFADTLTTLNLANNELTSDTFLSEELELPALKELNLSSNTFDSLHPLMAHFVAPRLETLDVSFNRLTSLPSIRSSFPVLTSLLVSNNKIRELSPEAVKGLQVLDCSSNELNSLNARIGLLGGPGGLRRLDVGGNRFRVPRWEVLEKGTEATLAWLRDRIPAGELEKIQSEGVDV
jgi:Leucine-rich repeat (LRR) protein